MVLVWETSMSEAVRTMDRLPRPGRSLSSRRSWRCSMATAAFFMDLRWCGRSAGSGCSASRPGRQRTGDGRALAVAAAERGPAGGGRGTTDDRAELATRPRTPRRGTTSEPPSAPKPRSTPWRRRRTRRPCRSRRRARRAGHRWRPGRRAPDGPAGRKTRGGGERATRSRTCRARSRRREGTAWGACQRTGESDRAERSFAGSAPARRATPKAPSGHDAGIVTPPQAEPRRFLLLSS